MTTSRSILSPRRRRRRSDDLQNHDDRAICRLFVRLASGIGRAATSATHYNPSEEISMHHRVVGISLGSSYSAVAAYELDTHEAEVLSDDEGQFLVPSVISFDSRLKAVVVGRAAKRNSIGDPENTVTGLKRELGRTF